MGLDWTPMPLARPGHEAEFEELIVRMARDGNNLALDETDIWQPVHHTLGAPRIGIDAAADDWLRTNVEPAELETARKNMHGYYVLDLLPPSDGFPFYSNHPIDPQLARYTFRAKFLEDVEDVLGAELLERAYTFMNAKDHARYGAELLETARTFARANQVEHVEHADHDRAAAFKDQSRERRAHIVFAAAKWCRYWSERGHGLMPWF